MINLMPHSALLSSAARLSYSPLFMSEDDNDSADNMAPINNGIDKVGQQKDDQMGGRWNSNFKDSHFKDNHFKDNHFKDNNLILTKKTHSSKQSNVQSPTFVPTVSQKPSIMKPPIPSLPSLFPLKLVSFTTQTDLNKEVNQKQSNITPLVIKPLPINTYNQSSFRFHRLATHLANRGQMDRSERDQSDSILMKPIHRIKRVKSRLRLEVNYVSKDKVHVTFERDVNNSQNSSNASNNNKPIHPLHQLSYQQASLSNLQSQSALLSVSRSHQTPSNQSIDPLGSYNKYTASLLGEFRACERIGFNVTYNNSNGQGINGGGNVGGQSGNVGGQNGNMGGQNGNNSVSPIAIPTNSIIGNWHQFGFQGGKNGSFQFGNTLNSNGNILKNPIFGGNNTFGVNQLFNSNKINSNVTIPNSLNMNNIGSNNNPTPIPINNITNQQLLELVQKRIERENMIKQEEKQGEQMSEEQEGNGEEEDQEEENQVSQDGQDGQDGQNRQNQYEQSQQQQQQNQQSQSYNSQSEQNNSIQNSQSNRPQSSLDLSNDNCPNASSIDSNRAVQSSSLSVPLSNQQIGEKHRDRVRRQAPSIGAGSTVNQNTKQGGLSVGGYETPPRKRSNINAQDESANSWSGRHVNVNGGHKQLQVANSLLREEEATYKNHQPSFKKQQSKTNLIEIACVKVKQHKIGEQLEDKKVQKLNDSQIADYNDSKVNTSQSQNSSYISSISSNNDQFKSSSFVSSSNNTSQVSSSVSAGDANRKKVQDGGINSQQVKTVNGQLTKKTDIEAAPQQPTKAIVNPFLSALKPSQSQPPMTSKLFEMLGSNQNQSPLFQSLDSSSLSRSPLHVQNKSNSQGLQKSLVLTPNNSRLNDSSVLSSQTDQMEDQSSHSIFTNSNGNGNTNNTNALSKNLQGSLLGQNSLSASIFGNTNNNSILGAGTLFPSSNPINNSTQSILKAGSSLFGPFGGALTTTQGPSLFSNTTPNNMTQSLFGNLSSNTSNNLFPSLTISINQQQPSNSFAMPTTLSSNFPAIPLPTTSAPAGMNPMSLFGAGTLGLSNGIGSDLGLLQKDSNDSWNASKRSRTHQTGNNKRRKQGQQRVGEY